MANNKDPEPKVEFNDNKPLDSKGSSRRWKLPVLIGILTAILLLGAVVSVSVYFSLKKAAPSRLVDVNLEEGETLTYRVKQDIEIQGGDTHKGTIHAIVAIRVLNKTSDEYWFAVKVNLSYVPGNVDLREEKTMVTDYFVLRLETSRRLQTQPANNGRKESFELYGNRTTNKEFISFIYGILDQLLPTLQRDLYEEVDKEKFGSVVPLSPEKSSRIPGAVNMHRVAQTLDKDAVFINNHFNRSDLVNFTSDIDMDMTYNDLTSINKSNGMVTESHAFSSGQLKFGEPIRTKSGSNVTMLNVSVSSHVTRIETHAFHLTEAEAAYIRVQSFVKLVPSESISSITPSNSSLKSSTNSPYSQNISTPTPSPKNKNLIRQKRSLSEKYEKGLLLFQKEVIGIDISGEAKVWAEANLNQGITVGAEIIVKFGAVVVEVFKRSYEWKDETRAEDPLTFSQTFDPITRETIVYGVTLGVEFSLTLEASLDFTFSKRDSILFFTIKSIGEVKAAITGYAGVWPVFAGARGSGTILKLTLPITLTAAEGVLRDASASHSLDGVCIQFCPHLRFLKLSAKTIYGEYTCRWPVWFYGCSWSGWQNYKTFFELDGFVKDFGQYRQCFP